MKENITITFERYRTHDGMPTCIAQWGKEGCQFFRTQRMGTWSTCLFAPDGHWGHGMNLHLERYEEGPGTGYLKPGDWCPMWKENVSMPQCTWTYEDYGEYWETECGEAFTLNEGTPKENNMTYCHGCGRKIREANPCA